MTKTVDIRQYQLIKLKKPQDSYVISRYNSFIDRYEFLVDHDLILDKDVEGRTARISSNSSLFIWTDNLKEAKIYYNRESADLMFNKLRNMCNTNIEVDSIIDRFNDYTSFYLEEDD